MRTSAQLRPADWSHSETIYQDQDHHFIWLGWEEEEDEGMVQTNQYLIIHKGEGILLDPGGVQVFPRVIGNVAQHIDIARIRHIFFTHQDPDVSGGIALWAGATPAQIHLSKLWGRFVPHLGQVDESRFTSVDDRGGVIALPGMELQLIPSHFMHSVGCLSLWDPRARILFSGDVGTAVFPPNDRYLRVENFDRHRQRMEGFHRRYMVSQSVCRRWVGMVRRLEPQIIAPQHGAIFLAPAIAPFLSWLQNLRCGIDLLDDWYGAA